MFLKELWHFNTKLFIAFVLFVFAIIIINYKWGAVATPIYQYGMFSSKFFITDTQTIYTIYVNDKPLDITKYAFAKRDMLLVSLQNYSKQKNTNEAVYVAMKQIPEKIGLNNLTQSSTYFNNTTNLAFTKWYKQLLQKIIGYPVKQLEVYQQKVQWQNNVLQFAASPQKLPFIVTN